MPATKKSKKGKLYVVKAKKLKHTKVRIPGQSIPKVKKHVRPVSPSPSASEDEDDKTDPLDKITLIFDLDETLIQATRLESKYSFTNDTYTTFGPHRYFLISYMYQDKNTHALVYARPHLYELIEFIKKNMRYFNICIWTNGYYEYAKSIVSALFGELFEPYIFLARDDMTYPAEGYIQGRDSKSNFYKTTTVRVIYDVLRKKKYETQNYLDGNLVKYMEFLFTHPDFKDKINKNRTILIDDLPLNIITNDSHNVIWVNSWNYNMYCDDTLIYLVNWLEKHKTVKTFKNIKLPNYATSSAINKLKSYNNPIDYVANIEKHCQAQYNRDRPIPVKKRTARHREVKLTKIKRAIARISKTKKST